MSNNNELILTRGYPASGKTTYAEKWVGDDPDHRVNICNDDVRESLGILPFGNEEEEMSVKRIVDEMVHSSLRSGKSVIISNTNVRNSEVKRFVRIAESHDVSVRIIDFKIDVEEIKKRNRNRDRKVDETVLVNQFIKKFPYDKWTDKDDLIDNCIQYSDSEAMENFYPYMNDPSKERAIVVDIDGTLAHHNDIRSPYDLSKVVLDDPDEEVIEVVNCLHEIGYKVIIMSGREDSCRSETIEWLSIHGVNYDEIHMRKSKDNRRDWIVKDEMIREYVEGKYYVAFCIDDRNQVVRHYRNMGYKVWQVQDGNF